MPFLYLVLSFFCTVRTRRPLPCVLGSTVLYRKFLYHTMLYLRGGGGISSPCLIRLLTICRECCILEDRAYDERGGLAIYISPRGAVEVDIIYEKSYVRVRSAFYFQLGDYRLALHWIPIFHRGLERIVHLQKEEKNQLEHKHFIARSPPFRGLQQASIVT